MDPLLDTLTLAPAAQLFELDPPRYTSSYGRRTEAIFKHNVPPAPMLISPENGLILYERVISTRAEHQLLDKLTKPKYYHPIPNIKKGDRKGVTHNGPVSTSAASARPSSSSGPHPRHPHSPAGSPSVSAGTGGGGPSAAASATGGRPGQHRALPGQQGLQQRSRSFSAGRGVGAPDGHPIGRKPLYPEDGPLKDYFSKERASVTATTVFTWGNRYKIGDSGTGRVTGGGGGSSRAVGGSEATAFSSYAPLQQKPPLRL